MYYKGILKPPLKLIGAKTRNRDKFYPLFPAHKTYVEPFLGTGGVLIGHPKAEIEIVNDADPYLINFYTVLKDQPNNLLRYIEILLERVTEDTAEMSFKYWKSKLVDTSSPLLKAVYYYLINKHCYNGIVRFNKKGECNSSWNKTSRGRGIISKGWMDLIHSRVKDVGLFNCDYFRFLTSVIADPPGESLFMFIDPPYRDCLTTYNGRKFTDLDHSNLQKLLSVAKFKWMLTINDDEFVRDLYKGYNIVSHEIFYNCSQTPRGRGNKPELIIMNYDK